MFIWIPRVLSFLSDLKSLLRETKEKLWKFVDSKMNSTPPQLPGSAPPDTLSKTDETWLLTEEDIGSISQFDMIFKTGIISYLL